MTSDRPVLWALSQNAVDDLWSGIVLSNVFEIRSRDVVNPEVRLDSNFYAEVVVSQTQLNKSLLIAVMQDLHTVGRLKISRHCLAFFFMAIFHLA